MTEDDDRPEDEGARFRLASVLIVGIVGFAGVVGLILLHLIRPDASATFIQQITLLVGALTTAAGVVWGLGRIAKVQAGVKKELTAVRRQTNGTLSALLHRNQVLWDTLTPEQKALVRTRLTIEQQMEQMP